MSAFLTATFHVVGVVFPCFLQLLYKAVPVLWTASFAYAALRSCAQSCAGPCAHSRPQLMEPLAA